MAIAVATKVVKQTLRDRREAEPQAEEVTAITVSVSGSDLGKMWSNI